MEARKATMTAASLNLCNRESARTGAFAIEGIAVAANTKRLIPHLQYCIPKPPEILRLRLWRTPMSQSCDMAVNTPRRLVSCLFKTRTSQQFLDAFGCQFPRIRLVRHVIERTPG
jgi:hypothetical protein